MPSPTTDLPPQTQREPLMAEFAPVSTEQWEAVITKDLKGADYAKKLLTQTFEGIALKPYYRREDIQALSTQLQSMPGTFPYVRGRKAKAGWGIRQDIQSSSIAEANRLVKQALERGATEIGFVSRFENGEITGQPIQSQADFNQLLDGIYPDMAPIHFEWGAESPIALAMLANVVRERGVKPETVEGSIAYDPLGALIAGQAAGTPEALAAKTVELLRFAQAGLPKVRVLAVQGQPYHNAGASAVQELACMLSAAVELLDRLTDAGLKAEDILPRMSLSVAVASNTLMEIAKIRALRLLWSNLVKQYGWNGTLAAQTPLHAETSIANKTLYDPNVNMLRTTMEAFAAVVAGCDSLTVRPYDETLREPTETAYRVARNIQLLLQDEAHLDKVSDPAGGAYALETLTKELADKAWALFLNFEQAGGFVKAAQAGIIQKAIAETRAERTKRLAQRRDILLGTTQYPNLSEQLLAEKAEPKRTSLNAKPDAALAGKSIAEQAKALASGTAVGALLTAEAKSAIETLPCFRQAAQFEAIRLKTEAAAQKSGMRPKVFLMTMGSPAMRTARATFVANFFGCAGFEILNHAGFASVDEAIAKAKESNPEVVVLCSSDAEYATLGPAVAEALKAQLPKAVRVIAGNPTESIEALKAAGFDDFVHVKTNLADALTQYQQKLGVL